MPRYALLCCLPLVALAAEPEGEDLLRKAAGADRANRQRAGNYLFREVIDYREANARGKMVLRRSQTFEVTFVEDEPYHRLIAVDGLPLPSELEVAEQARAEEVAEYRRKTPLAERRRKRIAAEGKRFRIDLSLISEHHTARIAGAAIVNGRSAWIIETKPKPGTRKPRNRSEWALAQSCRYWIDQETYHPLRLVSTQLYNWDDVAKGAVTESNWTPVDDVWLVASINSSNPQTRSKPPRPSQTDQTYSHYRKFATTTAISFEGLP